MGGDGTLEVKLMDSAYSNTIAGTQSWPLVDGMGRGGMAVSADGTQLYNTTWANGPGSTLKLWSLSGVTIPE